MNAKSRLNDPHLWKHAPNMPLEVPPPRHVGTGAHEFVIDGINANGAPEVIVVHADSRGQAFRIAVQEGFRSPGFALVG